MTFASNVSRVARIAAAFVFAIYLFKPAPILAQEEPEYPVDPALMQGMKWRNIGPYRGGRAVAVAGVADDIFTYYMGATGGGVWKTEDGGVSWKNVSDGFFKTGSVGAVEVAASDPNVVYVGMGEAPIRGVTTSHGDGVYKSTDAGKTWTHLGLEKTRQISRIQIHPKNPDVVYVAAQGNQWTTNPERGIYRSTDGGATWALVLHVDEKTGASDLSMDPTNPRILYAAFWEHQRLPWKVISGGEGGGVYKSTDGGDTWEELTEGLPEMPGKVGVAVSPANPDRVWAMVEADDGGFFRSDNAGKTWTRVNKQRVLRARAWYYTHVIADPVDDETVYVLNAPMMKSVDGGRTFKPIPVPHGDNHCLWINPHDNQVMINCNDGGANVSFNGGKTWSTQTNQPTAQFYRVITDNQFPYHVYGGQQDNSSVAIASRTDDGGIGREDWYPVGGCESAFPAFDPDDPTLVYAGCYQGIISEYNHATKQSRNVMAYPFLGLGADPQNLKYRFNWNAPIVASPHDPTVIYHAANKLLKSTDRGNSWEEISPDLTRNEPEKHGNGGGPITNEAAGAETYNTIFYVVESPHEAGTIWVGTDDGLVHLTRDGGQTWQDVTPGGIGEAQVNAIDVSPHDPASAYLAVTRYKFGDYTPHVFKTNDYGQNWERVVEGIGEEAFVRVVREDPARRGLLYAGTETGLYISFDDGEQWQPFQLNLPVVAITDLAIRNNDLVAATQGRAFWILDDLSPLHQLNDQIAGADVHLFAPRAASRMAGGSNQMPGQGQNPPSGAILYYAFAEAPDTSTIDVKLDILDGDRVIRTITPKAKGPSTPGPGGGQAGQKLPVKVGLNRFVWDLRHKNVTQVPKLFTFGSLQGYRVGPGTYTARLTVGEVEQSQSFEVVADPRKNLLPTDFREQQSMLASIYEMVDEIHASVAKMQQVREQVGGLIARAKGHPEADTIAAAGKVLMDRMTAWEEALVQPKQETFQDVINFPNKLNAEFIWLLGNVDSAGPPVTQGARDRFADLSQRWNEHRVEMNVLLEQEVAEFNMLVQQQAVPAVIVPAETTSEASPGGGG